MKLIAFLNSLIESKPYFGYLAAAVPTATGVWALIQKLTTILALFSVLAGLAVAAITFYVQWLQAKKLKSETKNNDSS